MTPEGLISRSREHSSSSLPFIGYCLFEVQWYLIWEAARAVLFMG
jgi:hypothetical protein